jgi:peptide/nickel transport system permease protein
MSVVAGIDPEPVAVPIGARSRGPWTGMVLTSLRLWRTRIGLGIVLLLVGVAIFGPFFAPHSPDAFVTSVYGQPSSVARLGGDNLGRDVLSRVLWGGRSVLLLAFLATAIGMVSGVVIGLVAADSRGRLDDVLMRTMDVVLAFPQIVLALVAVATVGPKLWLVVLIVGISHTPRVARLTRGAALEIVERDYVKAADVLGVSRSKILFGEVLPNITSPLLVEASLRMTYSIGLIAALNFLGFGLQPPAADWGLMINENRNGLVIMPWGAVAPVVAIALLTIGTNLVADGLSRALIGLDRGRSDG